MNWMFRKLIQNRIKILFLEGGSFLESDSSPKMNRKTVGWAFVSPLTHIKDKAVLWNISVTVFGGNFFLFFGQAVYFDS